MIACHFIKYLFIDNPNLFMCLVNMGMAMWLLHSGMTAHVMLSLSYKNADEKIQKRNHIHKPLCIQGARGCIIYAFCYIFGIYHWQLSKHWEHIGNAEDMVWLVIELISIMTMLQFLKIGRVVIQQNTRKRSDDNRCEHEKDCPVRNKCLNCQADMSEINNESEVFV